jgi:hypothetical protein
VSAPHREDEQGGKPRHHEEKRGTDPRREIAGQESQRQELRIQHERQERHRHRCE